MNRRSLLLLSLLAFPGRLFGQDPVRRGRPATPKGRRVAVDDEDSVTPPRPKRNGEDTGIDGGPETGPADGIPANFPNQPGFEWKTFPISAYTALDPNAKNPQTAIVDWIFRRTKPAPWHGDKIAVLCASRSQIRAYNSPKVLQQVADVVEQFVDANADILSIRVRFLAASDPPLAVRRPLAVDAQEHRTARATSLAASVGDTEAVITQMQIWQGFKNLGDTKCLFSTGNRWVLAGPEKAVRRRRGSRWGGRTGLSAKVETLKKGSLSR